MTGPLDGVVVPLVTPMSRPGVPSAPEAAPLLDALAATGVRRLMLLGSNGEGPLVRAGLTGDFVAETAALWRARVPGGVILVNVTAPGTDEALYRAKLAAEASPDALVLSPPIYFRHSESEVLSHYRAVAGLGLPVVAYNAPRYATPLTPACVDALIEMPGVAGVKDSSGDGPLLAYVIEAARRRPDFAVSQGYEQGLADALRAGARGIVPGIANLAPRLALDLVAAHDSGDRAETGRLQSLVTELTGLHSVRPGVPSVKALLASWGLCPPHAAPPLAPCTPDELRRLTAVVRPLGRYLLGGEHG
ncbi:dihydrodipicolinate synthase family protein [Sphaerisporangium viridialbum]|uniref:dihydrodipicolinate synthase family protein n=1 Tax=Sphaerisporangium viridialbum TaxID=46189 RepID=UPI003C7872B3